MEKITSFTIDHIKLQPGLYVSRKDKVGAETVTTFDLRLTSPNEEPVMNTAEMHTMEHLAATYLRNEPCWKENVLYFGPMGCRTGFYLLLKGDLTSEAVLPLVLDCFRFIAAFAGDVPGASAKDCGNYLDMNLPMANYWGRRYATLLENITPDRLIYPE
jgi:S-ribosylhomocysteine lyase